MNATRQLLLAVISLILAMSSMASTPTLEGDQIATDKGPLVIHPLVHATFAMSWNGKVLYFDPVGAASTFKGIPSPDLVFITDIHRDHLSPPTLAEVGRPDTQLVAPPAVYEKLPPALQQKTHILRNGESLTIDGIKVEAIAMYNLPESPDAYHTKGRGNGYILTMGGKRVYDSGDTDGTPEMRGVKKIDVAFVCMNPPYTMSVEEAADTVLAFKPRIVYPFHYRSPTGLNDVNKFKQLVSKNKHIEVRLRDWYPAN